MARNTKGQELKKEIVKTLGISPKKISVRYDGAYRIALKCWDIPKEEVQKVAQSKEKISRCEATGDILSGGNTFVFVEYDYRLDPPANAKEIIIKAIKSFNFDSMNSKNDWRRANCVVEIAEGMGLNAIAASKLVRTKEIADMIREA